MGDKAPDALAAFHMLSTGAAGEFNQRTPDVPGVYYQSYAFVLSHSRSDMLLFLPHLAVNWVEGGERRPAYPRFSAVDQFPRCGALRLPESRPQPLSEGSA